MKVILAQPRGFCAGVVRAIEIVERALEKYGPPVYVRHEIVHNKHVVESLQGQGRAVRRGAVRGAAGRRSPIFSAHGVAKSVEDEAQPSAACRCSTRPARWSPRCTTRAGAMSRQGRDADPDRPCRPSRGRRHDGPDPGAGATWCRPRPTSTRSTLAGRHAGRLRDADDAQRRRHRAASSRRCSAGSPTSSGPRREDICYATQNRQTARARAAQAAST